jgi:capsular polysaccharide export protein
LLAGATFSPALLARAARLRRRLIEGGLTKYNLAGASPGFEPPAGRRVVLVCGQVEDDASLRRGGGDIRTNQDLLRAARRTDPHAFLVYKPHPDVEAGMRRGVVRPEALAVMADHVAAGVPIAPLYALADEVQVMSSLAGFEALLRGKRVVCWGQPFFAGWGLTEDRAPIARRVRRLALDELVAAALILYPRYWDPVTGLPCQVELLCERLAAMAAPAAPRVPGWVRQRVARASGGWTAWWAAR